MARRARSSSGFATIGGAATVLVVLVGVLVTTRTPLVEFDFGSGFAFLPSEENGQVVNVNGVTGQGTGRYSIPGAAGFSLRIEQRDGYAVVVATSPDGSTRILYRLDDALDAQRVAKAISPSQSFMEGGGRAYLLDVGRGELQPVDPGSFEPIGNPLRFRPPIAGTVDGSGRAVVVEETTSRAYVVEGTAAGEAITVGQEGDTFRVANVGGRPVVVNVTRSALSVFDGGQARELALPAGEGELLVPHKGDGDRMGLIRRQGARGLLLLVDLDGGGTTPTTIDGDASTLRAPLVTAKAIYLLDPASSRITVLDPGTAAVVATLTAEIGRGDGALQAFVKDGLLWINNPRGARAVVVDQSGVLRVVDKYDPAIPELGDPDAPPEQPPPPPPPPVAPEVVEAPAGAVPPGPVATLPSTPPGLAAQAGNRQVRLTWGVTPDGGASIQRYRLTCQPSCGPTSPITIEGAPLEHTVTGLENGTSYRFELAAVNAVGEGPRASTGPIAPTADIPPTPTNVVATANPDGTVTVTWAADPGGLVLTGYALTATTTNPNIPRKSTTFDAAGTVTSFTTPVDALLYDGAASTDYVFTVQAKGRNREGVATVGDAGTAARPVSPFNVPQFGRGAELTVQAGGGQLAVGWPAAEPRGRPVTYVVERCAGSCVEVERGVSGLAAVAEGLVNGTPYAVRVTPTNAAGAGAPLDADPETPHQAPTVTITGGGGIDHTTIYVDFHVDWHGVGGDCSGGNGGDCLRRTQLGFHSDSTGTIDVCATNDFGETTCRTGSGRSRPKRLVATGGHWPCPGPFCGLETSRMAGTAWGANLPKQIVGGDTEVDVVCFTDGSPVSDGAGHSTTWWLHTTFGDGYPWMSAHYFGTNDFNWVVSGVRRC